MPDRRRQRVQRSTARSSRPRVDTCEGRIVRRPRRHGRHKIADELSRGSSSIVVGSAEEARTIEHQVIHMPKKLHCEVCARAKAHRTSKKKAALAADATGPSIPVRFGAQATADHLIKNDGGEEDDGIPHDTVAVVLLDRGTGWIDIYPKGANTAEHTVEALQHLAGARDKITSFYCDNATELKAAARHCAWRISTATPGQPQTNGAVERSVRTVNEGGSCGTVQSGFHPKWWPSAGKQFCFSRDTAMIDGDSCYHVRHGKCHLRGLLIPFGALDELMP